MCDFIHEHRNNTMLKNLSPWVENFENLGYCPNADIHDEPCYVFGNVP